MLAKPSLIALSKKKNQITLKMGIKRSQAIPGDWVRYGSLIAAKVLLIALM
jgi:hypothetical protein